MTSVISLKFPSKEEQERAIRFTVNKHYLSSLAMYLFDQYGTPDQVLEDLVAATRELQGFKRIQGSTKGTSSRIGEFLTIGWTSALQLRMAGAQELPTLRYSSAWVT